MGLGGRGCEENSKKVLALNFFSQGASAIIYHYFHKSGVRGEICKHSARLSYQKGASYMGACDAESFL